MRALKGCTRGSETTWLEPISKETTKLGHSSMKSFFWLRNCGEVSVSQFHLQKGYIKSSRKHLLCRLKTTVKLVGTS